MMGSAENIRGDEDLHEVRLPSFEMSMTEVTVAQYTECVAAGVCSIPDDDWGCSWGVEGRGNHPMNCVNWEQARTFANNWAGARLPSEAEWEFAARSEGREQIYPWGDAAPRCGHAVMAGCNQPSTVPVCSKVRGNTAQGLCDMGGNAWEWVADWYGPYSDAPTDGRATTTAAQFRVLRGGSGYSDASYLRAAIRGKYAPFIYRFNLGFRVARSVR